MAHERLDSMIETAKEELERFARDLARRHPTRAIEIEGRVEPHETMESPAFRTYKEGDEMVITIRLIALPSE